MGLSPKVKPQHGVSVAESPSGNAVLQSVRPKRDVAKCLSSLVLYKVVYGKLAAGPLKNPVETTTSAR